MLRAVAEPEGIERLATQIKESPMGEVRVPVRVANPDAPDLFWEAEFLVDSGASVSEAPVDVLNSAGDQMRVEWAASIWPMSQLHRSSDVLVDCLASPSLARRRRQASSSAVLNKRGPSRFSA